MLTRKKMFFNKLKILTEMGVTVSSVYSPIALRMLNGRMSVQTSRM